MTTTSGATDSTSPARIVPMPSHIGFLATDVTRAVARLRPAIGAGDGFAMLAALVHARAWWNAYPASDGAMGGNGAAAHLTNGWFDMHQTVAEAPASTLPAPTLKTTLGRPLHVGIVALSASQPSPTWPATAFQA